MKIEINDDGSVTIDGRVYVAGDGEPEEPKPWPQRNDIVFALMSHGVVHEFKYDNLNFLAMGLLQGNLFRTQSEAEAERDRRAAEHRVLEAWRQMIAPHQLPSKGFIIHELYHAMYVIPELSALNDGGVPGTIVKEMPDDVRRMMG